MKETTTENRSKGGRRVSKKEMKKAVMAFRDGTPAEVVATQYGVTDATIYNWNKKIRVRKPRTTRDWVFEHKENTTIDRNTVMVDELMKVVHQLTYENTMLKIKYRSLTGTELTLN